MKSGTTKFHTPVYWVPLGVCDSLLTTQTHTICRGALRFATQISPLLNSDLRVLLFHCEINSHCRNSYFHIRLLNLLMPLSLLFYVKQFSLHLILYVWKLTLCHSYWIVLLKNILTSKLSVISNQIEYCRLNMSYLTLKLRSKELFLNKMSTWKSLTKTMH